MSQASGTQAIMFADVSGSSALYKRIGNEEAKAIIDEAVQFMTTLTIVHEGTVVKTIGDEIMARFDTADQACEAAIAIQMRCVREPKLKNLGIRIGMAFGEILLSSHDVFGDTVNDAAFVAHIARANQIVVTQALVDVLSEQLQKDCQLFDRVSIKGDKEKTTLYRIEWELVGKNNRATMVMPVQDVTGFVEKFQLLLTVQGKKIQVLPSQTPFKIGRDPEKCNLAINSELASREHCHIEFRRGKYVLVDHSTNGTHVNVNNQTPIYLRREEFPLQGEGSIGIGTAPKTDNPWIISYKI